MFSTANIDYIKTENIDNAFLKFYKGAQVVYVEDFVQGVEYSVKGYTSYTIVTEQAITGNEELKEYKSVSNIKLYTPYLDLIDFGCVGDGVTDDTSKINQAIQQVLSSGGGSVFGRTNKFKVSSISIPNTDWQKIEIMGGGMPVPQFGTIGTYDVNKFKNQMEIISNLNDPTKGVVDVQSGTAYNDFNFAFLSLKNLRIKTYQNPNCRAVNAYYATQLNMENVYIDTGVYNVQCVEPTNGTTGIITPQNANGGFNYLRYVSVQGFHSGIDVHEHTDGDQIILHSCKNGLTIKAGDHASYFKRVLGQRNTNQVTVEGTQLFEIAQLNMEYVGTGQYDASNAWQRPNFEINDPNNLGIGEIHWANVRGNVGKVPYIRINGASGIIVKRIGAENRLLAPGNPDPNPA